MSYLVLARKYRPQTFEDIVGQNPVSQTLMNALSSGRVAHAYVFSGPRGVGKTTTARLLAKCLNCIKGPATIPCNECDSCQAINIGSLTDDVLEIDGASNRGIEQIRELRETAKYSPSRSRYRIFIIDEAHQITKDAFGALLKTLEEPPAHVVFMLATTEAHKIPSPILSRCQRFSLRPISAELVLKHLQSICQKEKINVADEALAQIVKFVEGSLRDALSLLDQAVVYSPEGITPQAIRELLGYLPLDVVRRFAEILSEGKPETILQEINACIQKGVDMTQLGKDLSAYFHQLLLAKAGVRDPLNLTFSEDEKAATRHEFAELERNIRLLSRCLDDMRHSESPRAIFEIYALRLGQKTIDPLLLMEKIQKLSASGPSFSAPPASAPAPRFEVKVQTPPPMKTVPAPQKQPEPASTVKSTVALNSSLTQEALLEGWAHFINQVGLVKTSLAAGLEEANPEWKQNILILSFGKKFTLDMVSRSVDIIKPLFEKQYSVPATFEFRLDKTLTPPPSAAPSTPTPFTPSVKSLHEDEVFESIKPDQVSPDIERALKHFPGTVKKSKSSS
jgi:DNA polymerase-3 subunit gamma/tau